MIGGAAEHAAILGLGLMGGSCALALREARAVGRLTGIDPNPAARAMAIERGVVDKASPDLGMLRDADLVILAAPVRAILSLIPQVGEYAPAGALVLDLGSTKRAIVEALGRLPPALEAVGGHPMCGKETPGLAAAEAGLFRERAFVLCRTTRTTPRALARARQLVAALGALPLELDAEAHDRIVALTSHLPFTAAAALMLQALAGGLDQPEVRALVANGFRDSTRVAAGEVTMMLDILLTNGDAVAPLARGMARRLDALADAIERQDAASLRRDLEAAAKARQGLNSLTPFGG